MGWVGAEDEPNGLGSIFSKTKGTLCARRLLPGWEAWKTPREGDILHAVIVPQTALVEGGIWMKNTGKRIFFSVVVVALANIALVVTAGAFASQR